MRYIFSCSKNAVLFLTAFFLLVRNSDISWCYTSEMTFLVVSVASTRFDLQIVKLLICIPFSFFLLTSLILCSYIFEYELQQIFLDLIALEGMLNLRPSDLLVTISE